MTKAQVAKLRHGLYRIHWKSGGESLASVGSGLDGRRWLAPTNWISGESFDSWKMVKDVTPIIVQAPGGVELRNSDLR